MLHQQTKYSTHKNTSTTVYSQVYIYTVECKGSVERTQLPNFELQAKVLIH